MKHLVIGLGYVGYPLACFLKSKEQDIYGYDVSELHINRLKQCKSPEYIPENIAKNIAPYLTSGALSEVHNEINPDIIWVCVPTNPPMLKLIEDVLQELTHSNALIIIKSTVTPGTCDKLAKVYNKQIIFSPEFLVQGLAWESMQNPTRVVFGTPPTMYKEQLESIYSGCYFTTNVVAESVKLLSNNLLAARLSVLNAHAVMLHKSDEDNYLTNLKDLTHLTGLDPRIGSDYLRPSIGYGGTCLPKDLVNAQTELNRTCLNSGIFQQIHNSNLFTVEYWANIIQRYLIKHRLFKVSVVGIGFSNYSNDDRVSPFKQLGSILVDLGYDVVYTYDHEDTSFQNFDNETLYLVCKPHLDLFLPDTLGHVIDLTWGFE